MGSQTVNHTRTEIKDKCYEVLSAFENQELTSKQVYELVNDSNIDKRTLAAVLFQMSNNKGGKYKDVYNVRKGVYVYSERPLKQRLTPSLGGRKPSNPKVTIEQANESFTITATTPSSNEFVNQMPVFDANTNTLLSMDEHMILNREDGSVWYARKVK